MEEDVYLPMQHRLMQKVRAKADEVVKLNGVGGGGAGPADNTNKKVIGLCSSASSSSSSNAGGDSGDGAS